LDLWNNLIKNKNSQNTAEHSINETFRFNTQSITNFYSNGINVSLIEYSAVFWLFYFWWNYK